MLTKSIRLTDEEVADLTRYVDVTGDVEAVALKRAALRGLRELRLEQGILAYLQGQGSTVASEIAGLPRAVFLQTLIDKGITMLEGPSTVAVDLEALAALLGDERLIAVVQRSVGSEP